MKKVIDYGGSVSDTPRPDGVDPRVWVARKTDLNDSEVLVWAPCGCVMLQHEDVSILTGCKEDLCHFSYAEAYKAINDLETAQAVVAAATTAIVRVN